MQPAIAQGVQKQRTRKAVLETARRVAGFVFQIKMNVWIGRQMNGNEMSIGRSCEVGIDLANSLPDPDIMFSQVASWFI